MPPKSRKPEGIAPKMLFDQVKSTAPWAFTKDPPLPAAAILSRAPELDKLWKDGKAGEDYFLFSLAAHFTTVGTFCPTDVDVRIRQHAWTELEGKRLATAIDRVFEIAKWDPRAVSARTVTVGKEVLAGHQGEWFSVLAGALGRALTLEDNEQVERTTAWIEKELTREAKLVTNARKKGSDQELLSIVTTVAHNLGDLSRVVDTWRPAHMESEVGKRYRRLGHEDGARFDGAFVFAGELNKKLMAKENHRFLPLRVPRALRREREFLLPFGPYFFEWGQMIGSTKLLEDQERAEVLLALARVHERGPEELGCLRAIAGIHAGYTGGIDKLARLLPASDVMAVRRPTVQRAVREKEAEFLRRFHADVDR